MAVIRTTQNFLEVLATMSTTANIRVTQTYQEVLITYGVPQAVRVTQVVLEVLRSESSAGVPGSFGGIY